VDRIRVVQNGEKWRVVVRTVMDIGVSETRTITRAVEEQSAAQEGLSCMKSVSRSVTSSGLGPDILLSTLFFVEKTHNFTSIQKKK